MAIQRFKKDGRGEFLNYSIFPKRQREEGEHSSDVFLIPQGCKQLSVCLIRVGEDVCNIRYKISVDGTNFVDKVTPIIASTDADDGCIIEFIKSDELTRYILFVMTLTESCSLSVEVYPTI